MEKNVIMKRNVTMERNARIVWWELYFPDLDNKE